MKLLRLTLFLAICARGWANYYGDPQSDAQWVPSEMEVEGDATGSITDFGNQMFNIGVDDAVNSVPGLAWNADECLRPPCGDGWRNMPTTAIDCPAPHTSPVWFSGSFDFTQFLGDIFFAAAVTGKPSMKKSKSASTGVTKVSKIAKAGKGAGYLGAALFVGYSIYNNIEKAEYFCSPCMWNEYSKVYWEGDSAQQELCQNDPMDEGCTQLIQKWQAEAGIQVCRTELHKHEHGSYSNGDQVGIHGQPAEVHGETFQGGPILVKINSDYAYCCVNTQYLRRA